MMNVCCPTITDYIEEREEMLKDFRIWKKLSAEEQMSLRSCTTEIQVDNKMKGFIRKYL